MSRPETGVRLALHELSLYNPGRIPQEKLCAAFAVRGPLLQRIVDDIRAETPASRPQHHLIVGQRGMGKTMLLARLAAELRLEPALAARFVPLVFVEEQYSVDRLSKFWLNCLDSLADAREAAGDRAAADRIDAEVARLRDSPNAGAKAHPPFADEVYAAFDRESRAQDQRPVLLLDNIQMVFERIEGAQQHALREVLMRPGAPILVGASPSPPPQDTEHGYGAAFYDHFKPHYLRPLGEEEMRALLLHLAGVVGNEKIRRRVVEHPGRLRILRQLTGGNPRTALMLFLLYAEDCAPSVFGDLENLLDRVTPLYKHRFEELTPQQQTIAGAIADHWDPVTAAQIASATRLPTSTISSQLDRLERLGTVERTELFGTPSAGYQIAERFFNVWYLMRSASRRQRRQVEFLTRFLESFYEPSDRRRLARDLMGERHFSSDRYLFSQALAGSLDEPTESEDLKRYADLIALAQRASDAYARLHEVIDFEALDPATLEFDALRARLQELVPASAPRPAAGIAGDLLADRRLFLGGERERLASRTEPLSSAELESLLESLEKNRALDRAEFGIKAADWFADRLANGQVRRLDDVEDWHRSLLSAPDRKALAIVSRSLPAAAAELGVEQLTRLAERHGPGRDVTASSWGDWGRFLYWDLHMPGAAEQAYLAALEMDPDLAWTWTDLGILCLHQYRFGEAEAAVREAIQREPGCDRAWGILGLVLFVEGHRTEEAESAYSKALQLAPDTASAWNGLGLLCADRRGEFHEAQQHFERALELEGEWTEDGLFNLLSLHRDYFGEGKSARARLAGRRQVVWPVYEDSELLHEALFACYEGDWGAAVQKFERALELRGDGFHSYNLDDWLRATAVMLHLGHGQDLIDFLEQRGDTAARLRPWVEAVRAVYAGSPRYLLNVAPEVRGIAEKLYEGIARRLTLLPDSTRKWRPPTLKPTRSRRRRA